MQEKIKQIGVLLLFDVKYRVIKISGLNTAAIVTSHGKLVKHG